VKWGKVISGNVKVGQVNLPEVVVGVGIMVVEVIEVLGIVFVLVDGFPVLDIVGTEVVDVGE